MAWSVMPMPMMQMPMMNSYMGMNPYMMRHHLQMQQKFQMALKQKEMAKMMKMMGDNSEKDDMGMDMMNNDMSMGQHKRKNGHDNPCMDMGFHAVLHYVDQKSSKQTADGQGTHDGETRNAWESCNAKDEDVSTMGNDSRVYEQKRYW